MTPTAPRSGLLASTVLVVPALDGLRELGGDVSAVVRESGISAEALEDPLLRIPADTLARVWECAERASPRDAFAVRVASIVAHRRGQMGLFEYVAANSSNLGDLCRTATQYQRLLTDAAEVEFRIEGDDVIVEFRFSEPLAGCRPFVEFGPVACVFIARRFGLVSEQVEVRFAHPPPPDSSVYEGLIQRTLHFDAEHTAIVFPAARLGEMIAEPDPALREVLERQARGLLETLPSQAGFLLRVRKVIAAALQEDRPNKTDVASKLGMSPRTLDRRLADESTTFQETLDGVRRELALDYLGRKRLSVTEVAFLLGFSSVGAFHRAFRRWTGTTPASIRTK